MRKCVLSCVAASAALAISSAAHAGVYRTITVDGDTSDWDGIAPAYTDPTGDGAANTTSGTVDFTNVYIANDANYLYFRFQLASPAITTYYYSNYFLNTDGNTATGYAAGNGSDILIQGDTAYQQDASGNFTIGTLDASNSQVQVSNFYGSGTDAEYRISRDATFVTGALSGTPVFTSNQITLLLESDGDSVSPGDEAGPVSYTFASVPEPASMCFLALSAFPLMRRRRASV